LKGVKSRYLHHCSTDFDEIWQDDNNWPAKAEDKNFESAKSKIAAAAILKIDKIVISQQRIDRSPENLAR